MASRTRRSPPRLGWGRSRRSTHRRSPKSLVLVAAGCFLSIVTSPTIGSIISALHPSWDRAAVHGFRMTSIWAWGFDTGVCIDRFLILRPFSVDRLLGALQRLHISSKSLGLRGSQADGANGHASFLLFGHTAQTVAPWRLACWRLTESEDGIGRHGAVGESEAERMSERRRDQVHILIW